MAKSIVPQTVIRIAIWVETSDDSGFLKGINRATRAVSFEPSIFSAKHFISPLAAEKATEVIKLQFPHAEVFVMPFVWRSR